MTAAAGFVCPDCGEFHEGLPRDIGADAPDSWLELGLARRLRSRRTDDAAEIRTGDHSTFFVRGVAWIPIVGTDDHFRWGMWAEVSEDDFAAITELWDDERLVGREFDGRLDTHLPPYPETRGVAVRLRFENREDRPVLDVVDEHPLRIEQREGITEARAYELVAPLLHAA